MVSDDGVETLDPKQIGRKSKTLKEARSGKAKDGGKKSLEEQIKKMEGIEEQMKWMQEQQDQYLGVKREGQR